MKDVRILVANKGAGELKVLKKWCAYAEGVEAMRGERSIFYEDDRLFYGQSLIIHTI